MSHIWWFVLVTLALNNVIGRVLNARISIARDFLGNQILPVLKQLQQSHLLVLAHCSQTEEHHPSKEISHS